MNWDAATSQVEKEQVKKAFEELDEKIKEALDVTQKRLDMGIDYDRWYDKEFRESETFKRLRAGN